MSTATLERPPRQATTRPPAAPSGNGRFPDDMWLNIPGVPVFAEHETTTQRGTAIKFGRRELELVAANCNRRIRETGDYGGISIGHTSESADATAMPLVGLAGPFRVGRLPGDNARWAILADLHVRREYANAVRNFPRRSAELWLADRYEDMYLDPIALLGAETPRLDLGLLYSVSRHQGSRRAEVKRYTKNGGRMTPQQVHEFIGAIEQLEWAQFAKFQMRADRANMRANGATDPTVANIARDYSRQVQQYSRFRSEYIASERYGRASAASQPLRESLRSLHAELSKTYTLIQDALRPAMDAALRAAKLRAARGEVGAYDSELQARQIPRLSPPQAVA